MYTLTSEILLNKKNIENVGENWVRPLNSDSSSLTLSSEMHPYNFLSHIQPFQQPTHYTRINNFNFLKHLLDKCWFRRPARPEGYYCLKCQANFFLGSLDFFFQRMWLLLPVLSAARVPGCVSIVLSLDMAILMGRGWDSLFPGVQSSERITWTRGGWGRHLEHPPQAAILAVGEPLVRERD